MQVTVQTIIDSALDLADMRNSAFIGQLDNTLGTTDGGTKELLRYANMAYKDLYQQIVASKEFYFTQSSTINIIGGTIEYALPSDFYKLDGVDLQIDISSQRFLTLKPFQFLERNKFRSGLVIPLAPYGQFFRYLIRAGFIDFLPMPSNSATVILWYTPEPAVLTLFSQTLALPIGGDEYMSLYCACAMLAKEETDTSALDAKRQQVIDQLLVSLKDRDQGSASFVVDESTINMGSIYPGLFGGDW